MTSEFLCHLAIPKYVLKISAGLSVKKPFPGSLAGLDAFLIWYSDKAQKPVLDQSSSAAEPKRKGKGKEVEKLENGVEGATQAEPSRDVSLYPERYADGEEEEADGGVPLFWS